MARRSWESLSEGYRNRLESKGITPAMHEAGASIKAARGHERTPEHPAEGVKRPKDFPEWFDQRRALVNKVARRKAEIFGRSRKFNSRRSRKLANEGSDGSNPPTMAQLRWALEASEEEIMAALESRDDDFDFLFYH